jgi:hypothetical protein
MRRPEPLIDPAHYDLYGDFLAFVSKDRVGEGAWRKLFSKRALAAQTALQAGRGLKSQRLDGILTTFGAFTQLDRSRQVVVSGAMRQLRDEQQRRLTINRAGGHHRSKRNKR